MRIELNPPVGVGSLLIGMSLEDAVEACAVWGQVSVSRGSGDLPTVLAAHPRFQVVAHCEDGSSVTAVEVWQPAPSTRRDAPDIAVLFRGLDIFRTPARELLAQLAALGYRVANGESDRPSLPELTLGFTRDSGHEVPMEDDGLPLFFEAVLVARAGYYG
ncbi:hypothetical protein ACIBLA_19500 [Streptomyces sp. NPDC050433]|uniref:hypothetical protein n=1 Tax=Streptomyces sp. NPDC050433 TaxID=3365615 RepID=UPI00378C00DB